MGAGYGDEDLIFARPDGSPWPPMQFSSDYRRATRRRGFRVRFHDLRHTNASHLLKESVLVNVVSERLGHANPSITLNVYAHVGKWATPATPAAGLHTCTSACTRAAAARSTRTSRCSSATDGPGPARAAREAARPGPRQADRDACRTIREPRHAFASIRLLPIG